MANPDRPAALHEDVRVATARGTTVSVGPLRSVDHQELYDLFAEVLDRREGFPHEPPLTPEGFDAVWSAPGAALVVRARRVDGVGAGGTEGPLLGAYYLRPNFAGRAAHIANAGYVVSRTARRLGVGRQLVKDSIARAPLAGFDAIQFNLVFAANPARGMYEELGWREIGRIPEAVDGDDAIIYWRRVGQPDPTPGSPGAR